MSKIRQFIVDNFLFGDGDELREETSFLETNIIDSTGILELIMFIEEGFGIHIEDDEVVPENLDTINNIECFVHRKLLGDTI